MVLPALDEVHLQPVHCDLDNLNQNDYHGQKISLAIKLSGTEHLVNRVVGAGVGFLPFAQGHLALKL